MARSRGYELLASLLLRGATTTDADADAIAMLGEPPTDPEEVRTQYVAAFDLGVPPYASTFLEANGRAGGKTTRAVLDAIAADDRTPVTDEVAADHLGVLLAHMGGLCRNRRDEHAARFAAQHVLNWLPAYVATLEALGVPFWTNVVRIALDVTSEHVQSSALPPAPIGLDLLPGDLLPEDPLADPQAGLREVAGYLASAARSGLFMTDADCGTVARALDLPRGFGPRRARIETMLRSAATYEALAPLCAQWTALAQARADRLRALFQEHQQTRHGRQWIAKITATQRTLATLGRSANPVHSLEEQG